MLNSRVKVTSLHVHVAIADPAHLAQVLEWRGEGNTYTVDVPFVRVSTPKLVFYQTCESFMDLLKNGEEVDVTMETWE